MRLIPITKLVNHEVAYLIKELWEAIDNTNKRLDTLADDNQQLMEQISTSAVTQAPLPVADEPKPLLADVEVGWVCERSDGKYVQIDSVSCDRPCPIMCKSDIGGMDCFGWDGKNHNALDGKKDIVSCEPLATEGTAEWAWQMNKLLGKKVMHPHSNCITDGNITRDNKDMFLAITFPTGWQLYEPKQELVKCEYCRGRGSYISSSAINPGYVRCQTCNGTGKVEKPEPRFRVGDWVELSMFGTHQCQITDINHKNGYYLGEDGENEYEFENKDITRKISPFKVIVRIGCLRGTVAGGTLNGIHVWFHLIDADGKIIATIRIESLDIPTRELVQSLLKAQEENNG